MSGQTEEEPRITCPMCAGTGKVRDYTPGMTPFSAGTYITIDPMDLEQYDITAMYGT